MLRKISVIFGLTFLLMVLILDTNQDKIFLYKANKCLKNNDTICIQENLEKAFSLGVDDENYRDLYVNSIITSPFDLTAQEKLLKFLSYKIEDRASLKVEYFIHDLKLEIFRKYNGNYIKRAVYNQKILRWGKLPITYNIVNNSDAPQYFINEIENALTEWEKVTEHKILFEKNTENPNIIIELEKKNIDNNNEKFVVAYTTPTILNNNLEKMCIEFYTTTPKGDYLPQNLVYNISLHEIAHALGLMGHSDNKNDVMYMTKDSFNSKTIQKESLTKADINTMILLYKIKPDITNDKNIPGDYFPFFILGSKKEINNEKKEEAKKYINKAPEFIAGYVDLAESYVAEKKYSKAIKTLEHALKGSKEAEFKEILYYNLAVSYYHIDQLEIAKDYLNKSIELSDTCDKRFFLAEIYNKIGNINLAIKEYSKLLAQEPNNIEYVIALTNLYINDKKYLKARNVLKNYFKLNPKEKNNPRFEPYGIIKKFL